MRRRASKRTASESDDYSEEAGKESKTDDMSGREEQLLLELGRTKLRPSRKRRTQLISPVSDSGQRSPLPCRTTFHRASPSSHDMDDDQNRSPDYKALWKQLPQASPHQAAIARRTKQQEQRQLQQQQLQQGRRGIYEPHSLNPLSARQQQKINGTHGENGSNGPSGHRRSEPSHTSSSYLAAYNSSFHNNNHSSSSFSSNNNVQLLGQAANRSVYQLLPYSRTNLSSYQSAPNIGISRQPSYVQQERSSYSSSLPQQQLQPFSSNDLFAHSVLPQYASLGSGISTLTSYPTPISPFGSQYSSLASVSPSLLFQQVQTLFPGPASLQFSSQLSTGLQQPFPSPSQLSAQQQQQFSAPLQRPNVSEPLEVPLPSSFSAPPPPQSTLKHPQSLSQAQLAEKILALPHQLAGQSRPVTPPPTNSSYDLLLQQQHIFQQMQPQQLYQLHQQQQLEQELMGFPSSESSFDSSLFPTDFSSLGEDPLHKFNALMHRELSRPVSPTSTIQAGPSAFVLPPAIP